MAMCTHFKAVAASVYFTYRHTRHIHIILLTVAGRSSSRYAPRVVVAARASRAGAHRGNRGIQCRVFGEGAVCAPPWRWPCYIPILYVSPLSPLDRSLCTKRRGVASDPLKYLVVCTLSLSRCVTRVRPKA